MLRELSVRELTDIEMDMVSGGEGDEIVVTGTRIPRYRNPYEGMTGSQIASMLGLTSGSINLPQIYVNIPVSTGGGSTPTPPPPTETTTTTTTQPGDCTTEYHYQGWMQTPHGTAVPREQLTHTTTSCGPTTTTTTTQQR